MKINTIQIWFNGALVDCTEIDALIVRDNLFDEAEFAYKLFNVSDVEIDLPEEIKKNLDVIPTSEKATIIVTGNVKISGIDYENWGKSADINLAAYQYICSKLNLTLKP